MHPTRILDSPPGAEGCGSGATAAVPGDRLARSNTGHLLRTLLLDSSQLVKIPRPQLNPALIIEAPDEPQELAREVVGRQRAPVLPCPDESEVLPAVAPLCALGALLQPRRPLQLSRAGVEVDHTALTERRLGELTGARTDSHRFYIAKMTNQC